MHNSKAEISIFLFAIGVFYGLGEMIGLEFSFFTASSVTDFFSKSAKAAPILILPVIILALINLGASNHGSTPITQNFVVVSGAEASPAKPPRPNKWRTFSDAVAKAFLKMFTNIGGQIVSLTIVAIWGFLTIVVQKHDKPDAVIFLKNGGNQIIEMHGNLLATNSATVALYSKGDLHMIPLSNVSRIEYKQSYYARIWTCLD